MKPIALLTFALAFSPALVLAQQSPVPAPDAAFPRPDFAAMGQMHQQMEQIHQQARTQMLASLSPAHRALLASVVGQLAIAPNPDRAAAARALDAALTQNEARSVLGIEAAARNQSRGLMEAARAKFESSLSADQRAQMAARMGARREGQARVERTPDPGRTLLDLALGHGGEHGFGPHGGFAGGPPPQ